MAQRTNSYFAGKPWREPTLADRLWAFNDPEGFKKARAEETPRDRRKRLAHRHNEWKKHEEEARERTRLAAEEERKLRRQKGWKPAKPEPSTHWRLLGQEPPPAERERMEREAAAISVTKVSSANKPRTKQTRGRQRLGRQRWGKASRLAQ